MTHRMNLKGLRANACLTFLSLPVHNKGLGQALQDTGVTKAPFFLLWWCIYWLYSACLDVICWESVAEAIHLQ